MTTHHFSLPAQLISEKISPRQQPSTLAPVVSRERKTR